MLPIANTAFAETIDAAIVCNGDEIEYFKHERKVVGKGNIKITYKDTILTCDKVTVWTDTKKVKAEGNVRITKGENFFAGESITYSFEKEAGTIMEFSGYAKPWYTRGESAERTGPDEFIVNNGYITSCDREKPHYKISARKVLIYPDSKVVVRDATVKIGDIPIFWLPVYAHPLDEDRPRVSLIPGKNSAWGNYLLSAWRYNLDPKHKGFVRIDYRERKDIAYGIDHIYDTGFLGKGTFRVYYTRERDLGRDHIYDSGNEGDPTVEQEKFLVQMRHKWEMTSDTTAIAELYKYKDKDFRKEYFDSDFNNEFEKDINPESYLLITKQQPLYTLSLLTQKRANRFEEVVERLPEAKLDIFNTKIGQSNFYYNGEFSAVNLNKKFPRSTDEALVPNIPTNHSNRFDIFNKLSYAAKMFFLRVTPFAGLRNTYYTRGIVGNDFGSDSNIRNLFSTGVNVSTKFYKVLDVSGSHFGMELDNLRHVITPSISYNYNPVPTINKDNFYEFDALDALDRNNTILFSLENKLQTKRGKQRGTIELARLGISTTYDFKKTPGSQFLDYIGELELRPFDWLTVTSKAIVDSHKRSKHEWLKEVNTDVVVAIDDFSFGLSHSYTNNETNNILGQVEWRINPQWKIKAYENFDFKRLLNEDKKTYNLREQRYVITRDLHCWEVDLHYNVFSEKGEEVLVVFRLKAFPKLPFEFGRSYNEPKIGPQPQYKKN